MNILIIGQCSLHWGRMEFGNIGNYYIIEPFFRELHRCFPGSEIRTTMQMSERFCRTEKITCLPMNLYYGWRTNELQLAKNELKISENIKNNSAYDQTTDYIEEVKRADIVIDFSGDIWGDNANFLGDDRFEVGLIKDKIAQNLGKPTALLAGSPGPFSCLKTQVFAKEVYAKFDIVTNREPISTSLLVAQGFDISKTVSLACPSFLFEPAKLTKITHPLHREGLLPLKRKKPIVGFILCGWNFKQGPFDLWPRDDGEYIEFVKGLEFVTKKLGAQVCLMSHANGFDIPPLPFRLKHGRDFHIIKQLQALLDRRGIAKDVICMDGVYDSWQTKTMISTFDMLISGRIHGAVASLSEFVPTVIIDYGHNPKAHKLMGIATLAGVTEYVANAVIKNDLVNKIEKCWGHRKHIRQLLERRIPEVKKLANQNFTLLASILK